MLILGFINFLLKINIMLIKDKMQILVREMLQ